jgi:hypothetical protein
LRNRLAYCAPRHWLPCCRHKGRFLCPIPSHLRGGRIAGIAGRICNGRNSISCNSHVREARASRASGCAAPPNRRAASAHGNERGGAPDAVDGGVNRRTRGGVLSPLQKAGTAVRSANHLHKFHWRAYMESAQLRRRHEYHSGIIAQYAAQQTPPGGFAARPVRVCPCDGSIQGTAPFPARGCRGSRPSLHRNPARKRSG